MDSENQERGGRPRPWAARKIPGGATVLLYSFAKINLSLDVQGDAGDGYHRVDMVMQQLAFHDDVEVTFLSSADPGFRIELTSNRSYLPSDSRNLAWKAADLMVSRHGGALTAVRAGGVFPDGVSGGTVRIHIQKRIPVAAGLAGGSGNGAAVLHGLNVLWGLDLSLQEIMDLSAELGSDVPFCAAGQAAAGYALPKKIRKAAEAASCARATGRGTELAPCRGLRSPVVFAKPRLSVSTKEVYQGIDSCPIPERPDNDRLVSGLQQGLPLDTVSRDFINVLENYTLTRYRKTADLKRMMQDLGPVKTLMSGSGPTVFSVFRDMKSARVACARLRERGYEAYWTKCV